MALWAAVSRHPSRVVVLAFACAILLGGMLLMVPAASRATHGTGAIDALFTSTSAVTVTGLATVSIADWSLYGQLVILLLVQVGGFGIMTIGALLAVTALRRMGLRHRMLAQVEVGSVPLGEMRELVGGIARITLLVEAVVALILTARLWAIGAEEGMVEALYSGVFHAVSAFNNAGVSLYDDNLMAFASDPAFILPVSAAIILGGLGFPVIIELRRCGRPSKWSLHTKLTLLATAALLVIGPTALLALEWSNEATIGSMSTGDKVLSAWFQGISPRTAGFNTIFIGAMEETSLLFIIGLMFVGAGPASTSGGIKITTFALLAWVLWSELRGDPDVTMLRRRIPTVVVRQAIAIVLMAIGTIALTSMTVLVVSDASVSALDALFEATSAFGTVGLSTGITARLPDAGHIVVMLLMLAGRVGPVTLATAFVVRERRRLFRYAEERPILG